MEANIELGIILKTDAYRDADIRCHILTPTGIKTATAAGAQKAGAKLKSAIQLFTIAEFGLAGSRITGAHVLQLGNPIARDINRYYLACSCAEVLLRLDNHGKQIFHLTARTFQALANTETSAYKIFINFYTKLLVLLGYDTNTPDEPDNTSTQADQTLLETVQKFKEIDNERINDIKLGLDTAKRYINLLRESYIEHLDIKIPNTEIF